MACGCGRSPTGKCIGWHKLSEDDYRQKLAEYENKQLQKRLQQKESYGEGPTNTDSEATR
jgi:hypothetical protein